ncbi:MAG: hypothetical protein GY760_12310 [Deltaproteobacteria bacterium]|nr:hypothetical protein [Deltaproteobacteria bacterium]
MAISFDFDNDEFATLFFYMQINELDAKDPLVGKLMHKMESVIYSRFSIDEIEKFRNRIFDC